MIAAVRYHTRSGNTKKLAEAMAAAVSLDAADLTAPLQEKVDVLFLGCSYYAFDVDEAVKTFIVENRQRIGQIVCFGTSAMMQSMKKPVEKVARAAGVAVADAEFHCRGAFGPLHKGRPGPKDLEQARTFAKQVIKEKEMSI